MSLWEDPRLTELASLFSFDTISPQSIFPPSSSSSSSLCRTYSGTAPSFDDLLDDAALIDTPASPVSSPSFSRASSVESLLDSSEFSPSSSPSDFPAATPMRKGGRKKGSSIQCDPALINRLLPLSTKSFNEEIRSLRLSNEEIVHLKFARRRIKNARAAQKRRSKMSTSMEDLQQEVKMLRKQLQAALAENHRLKGASNR